MFGWSAQAAGGPRLDAFIDQVSSRQYDAAEGSLRDLQRSEQLDDEEAARCQDLLHQIRRLVQDQERLAEVAAGLAFDEDHTCAELRRVASSAAAMRSAVETVDASPEVDGSTAAAQPVGRPATMDSANDRLEIWLLGSCRFSCGNRDLDGGNGDQAAAVLRYLASQPVCGVHKDQLANLFWPESDERSARRNLHQVVYNIRRRLQSIGADQELVFVNDRYRLGSDDRQRDIDELELTVTSARKARDEGDVVTLVAACKRVDDLYVGDFLADHLYDEWSESPRRHYRMLFREAAGFLLSHWWDVGRLCHVVELAERVLGFDPADEEAARHLMSAHDELGHPQLSAAAYVALTDALTDLGVSPSTETTALARRVVPQLPR